MATAPELPFLGAGAVALIAGVKREGHFPAKGWSSIIATIVLVLVASATTGSKAAPLVRAVGILLLLAAVIGAVRAFQVSPKTRRKP
jgi:peptidoglycan/LPS O-acetylase OafA/YrhL